MIFSFVTIALLFIFRSLEQTPDSLSYATAVRSGEGMFHPHHILFAPAVKGVYLMISAFCTSCNVILAAQIHNILWASLAIGGGYLAVYRFTGATFTAGMVSSLLAVSNGFWLFSTQAEVYVPATAPLILLTPLLAGEGHKMDASRKIVAIFLLSLAVLYHQSNVLFCIPLFFLMSGESGMERLKAFLSIVLPAGMLVLLFYLGVFLSSGGGFSLARFVSFCIPYASHPNPEWGTSANFSILGAGRLVDSQLRDLIHIPEGTSIFRYAAVGLFSLFMLTLSGLAVYFLKLGKISQNQISFPVVWLFTYYLFNLWWLPGEEELFISTIFPLLLLAGTVLKSVCETFLDAESTRRTQYLLIAATVAIGVVNFTTTILPRSGDRGELYREAEAINDLSRNECAVIAGYGAVQNLSYYFDKKNADEIEAPLLSIYRFGRPDRTLLSAEAGCLIVPAKYLSPSYSVAGYSGLADPPGWLKLVEWILGIEYLDNGDITRYRFVRRGASGEYLVITPHERDKDVLKRLLLKLG